MRKAKKTLLAAACACALVVGSVAGTVAYLTSSDEVKNTFTVGNVAITLDEADVDELGSLLYEEDGKTPVDRVDANSYKLLPGHTYVKDPTVHVAANSEDSWVFVKVENGIKAYEKIGRSAIAQQIANNDWQLLDDTENIYFKSYSSKETVENLIVFDSFVISDAANSATGWSGAGNAEIVVTAYAVQKDGFSTAQAAWDATFGKSSSTSAA